MAATGDKTEIESRTTAGAETTCVRDRYSRSGADGERWVWSCPECGVAYDTPVGDDAPTCDCRGVP